MANNRNSSKSPRLPAGFEKLLVERIASEDRSRYDAPALTASTQAIYNAIAKHRPGKTVIAIDEGEALCCGIRPVSAITIINDNMPFLFDSVLGEINETGDEPLLVIHPVIEVRRKKGRIVQISAAANRNARGKKSDRKGNWLSVIHIHIRQLEAKQKQALKKRFEAVLDQVHHAVADWKQMLIRLEQAISVYRHSQPTLKRAQAEEAAEFLEWLRDDNFTFLGMREYVWSGNEKTGTLRRHSARGLGILSDPEMRVLRRGGEAVTTTPQIRAFMTGNDPLIVTKANIKSLVHRRVYLDYIGIKTFDDKGRPVGELRIVGLFTSTAYTRSVMRIPFLRSKTERILARMGYDRKGHSGKAIANILETYPRDELFQIDDDSLEQNTVAILALLERPRLRVLPRAEKFGRYVSVLVYVPRDQYNSHAREKIGAYLAEIYEGRLSAFYPDFPEGTLARVHFIIGRDGGSVPKVSKTQLEDDIRALVRTWEDSLADLAFEGEVSEADLTIAHNFPYDYRAVTPPAEALHDAAVIANLDEDKRLGIDFFQKAGQQNNHAALKIFSLYEPVALSSRVPVLENMGFHVISERTFVLNGKKGEPVFIHDMEIESGSGAAIDLADDGALFEDIFLRVSGGLVDNDGYNGLALSADLKSDEILILRGYGRYLQQAGILQSQSEIAETLNRHALIAGYIVQLFFARFDPAIKSGRTAKMSAVVKRIEAALEKVTSLEDDTVLRRFVELIKASQRCNYFADQNPDAPPQSFAFKLRPKEISFLPEPRPMHEIFVYGAEVEGVHLRFGMVARGGLRWSDRPRDYRTEVLGLVKAQQVKNAVIIPVGAKGGFFPKKLPAGGSRQEIYDAGRAAYQNFISSLLSLTDNLEGEKIIAPRGIVRHDGDDPYFVVAADKGTAAFSDTANAISADYDFWLDDAFASGGSAGYDHKKMGITAKGAWEAVKRHFREINHDIQTTPFSVVGVGDMSGDVFGNGMLLSRQTRLIAAFDHRDIFIDPDPDPATSFKERQRMFKLPRSSWQDYDKKLLSKGGSVFSRTQKSIVLSKQAALAIGLEAGSYSPFEIMSAILKADVDLLYFGGIGTYARASTESNADVGDRANDAIRITADQIGAKVIGEGANLGLTQLARIEFGLLGGRCNSDAIDNSGGVNSSDVEVNIKIALAAAMRTNKRAKKLTRPARNKLLEKMTGEVADLVLKTNYDQTLAISLSQSRGLSELAYHGRLMTSLENRGRLDRKVELLPDDKALGERQARGEALSRAEIGVLLSYAKIVAFDDVLASNLPDQAYFESVLADYFPPKMRQPWKGFIAKHRLRREIIASELVNDAINRGGPAFVTRQLDLSGRSSADVIKTYAIIRDGFELSALYDQIDALDNKIDGNAQLELYRRLGRHIHNATSWWLKNAALGNPIAGEIAALKAARKKLEPQFEKILPEFLQEQLKANIAEFEQLGAPVSLARTLAMLPPGELIPDIALIAQKTGRDLAASAGLFFEVTEFFRLGRIATAARAILQNDYYDGLAVARSADLINMARQRIAITALSRFGGAKNPFEKWQMANKDRIDRAQARIHALLEGGELNVSKLTVAAGLLSDLALA